MRQIHPATKDKPPIGVIAPKVFSPEIESAYKLPENKMIPATSNIPDQ